VRLSPIALPLRKETREATRRGVYRAESGLPVRQIARGFSGELTSCPAL
jgi:hypothetical protein